MTPTDIYLLAGTIAGIGIGFVIGAAFMLEICYRILQNAGLMDEDSKRPIGWKGTVVDKKVIEMAHNPPGEKQDE